MREKETRGEHSQETPGYPPVGELLFRGRKKQKTSPATATAGEAHLVQYFQFSNSLVQAIRHTPSRAALPQRAAAMKRLPALESPTNW